MNIADYFADMMTLVERYRSASFVISAAVTFEIRPGEQGYLTGTVQFTDQTALYFREFVDGTGEVVQKVSYSYPYQRADGTLILRYDNARHRARFGPEEHKHVGDAFILASAPSLTDVLAEITALGGWV
jgi:hypothetical protein